MSRYTAFNNGTPQAVNITLGGAASNTYTGKTVVDGQGGVAGFGKGSADVSLNPEGAQTRLKYNARAQVGGKMAQVGSRLIEGTSNKLAGEFFSAFAEKVQAGAASAAADSVSAAVNPAATPSASLAPTPAVASVSAPKSPQPSTGWKAWVLVGGVLAVAAVAYLVTR